MLSLPKSLQLDELFNLTFVIMQSVDFVLVRFDLCLQLKDLVIRRRQELALRSEAIL